MPKSQLSKNPSRSHAVCLCGCGGRSSRTIARHSKVVSQQARLVLNAAYPVFDHPPPPEALQSPSIPDSSASANPHQYFDDEMHTDPPLGHQHAGPPSPSLDQVWSGRTDRRERQDEDLCPSPGPSDHSDYGDESSNNGEDTLYPLDDEPPPPDPTPTRVEVSARDRLTSTYQLDAALAGMSPAT